MATPHPLPEEGTLRSVKRGTKKEKLDLMAVGGPQGRYHRQKVVHREEEVGKHIIKSARPISCDECDVEPLIGAHIRDIVHRGGRTYQQLYDHYFPFLRMCFRDLDLRIRDQDITVDVKKLKEKINDQLQA